MVVIHRMLDLSLGHLSPETIRFLDDQDRECGIPAVIVFEKHIYGYFLPILPEEDAVSLEEMGYPEDLKQVIRYATAQGCDWIMLDCDGEIVEELPFWSDGP